MRFACFAYETELTVYLPSARIWRTWTDWILKLPGKIHEPYR